MRVIFLLLATLSVVQLAATKDAPSAALFSCRGRSAGYYADLDTGCQNYHMCDAGGRRYTYSCPNQTLFQQRVMICDHWFMVDCSLSETHFGANLLIGQKNRQFVEQSEEENGHHRDRARSYPTRTREFYAGSSTAVAEDRVNSSRGDTKLVSSSANEINQAQSAKNPSLQSVTKKLFDDDESVVKASETSRYSYQFSPPSTGPVKTTSERSWSSELTNNPFFRSLAVGSSPATLPDADKGERDLLTFLNPQQGKDHVKTSGQNVFHKVRDENTRGATSTSGTPRSSQTSSSHETSSTPLDRQVTPKVRHTPSFPNHQQQRTSTRVTTAIPLTYDYNFVTSEGHSNHPRTETPLLQNNFPRVQVDVEDNTSEPSLTTQYEFLKTRERVNAPSGASSTRISVTPAPPANHRLLPSATEREGIVPAVQRETTNSAGNQKPPGGFRFKASDVPRISNRGWGFTSVGVLSSVGTGIVSDTVDTAASRGNDFTPPIRVVDSTGFRPIVESSKVRFPDIKQVPDPPFVSETTGPSVSDSKYAHVDDVLDLSVDPQTALDEDEVNINTVEVRVVDPRRMFFIPDSTAREAEMLSSNNETVLTISLPPSRHDGAMKFKGVRKSEGRRNDCPQCHPAFLLPGQCHPCVHIRR